jgi:CRISPR-associated protein (TIGR03986 family)
LVQDKSKRHDPDVKQQLAHYATPTQETTIRGHKLYWHRDNVSLNEIQETPEKIAKAPKQYTRIKPVKAGVSFRFCIYFENLRDFELGALLWALTLLGEAGKDHCYSLGMGKPLGMGAIKISPTLCLNDRKARYNQLFSGTDWQRGERQEPDMQQFISAFEAFVLLGMDTNECGQAKSLSEVHRIKMLLKMLEWPGPDRSLTEYMTIEPINEYTERPVLPDPGRIVEPTGAGKHITQRPSSDRRGDRQDYRRGRR